MLIVDVEVFQKVLFCIFLLTFIYKKCKILGEIKGIISGFYKKKPNHKESIKGRIPPLGSRSQSLLNSKVK